MRKKNEIQSPRGYKKRAFRSIFENNLKEIFEGLGYPLIVRQIFYAMTVRGVIPKTENGYHQTCYYLGEMRREEVLPFSWIADNTRWRIKPETYYGAKDALYMLAHNYRRDVWDGRDDRVEIWCEKDALAGVIRPITDMYDVPLYIARGYSSMTFLYNAAQTIKSIGKPTYIYHFGDFDPSGIDAANNILRGLEDHGAEINFTHVAITQDQIQDLTLPTRPTKKSDPRSKAWGNIDSVELDALQAPLLKYLVKYCILNHIDEEYLEDFRQIQEEDRWQLEQVWQQFQTSTNFSEDESSETDNPSNNRAPDQAKE